MIDLRSRAYDPGIGRFTSRDAFGGLAQAPQTANRYSYALNGPYRYTDPSGRFVAAVYQNGPLLLSIGIQMIPVVGDAYSAFTGIIGFDPIAGVKLSDGERAIAIASAVVLGGGLHLLGRMGEGVADSSRLGRMGDAAGEAGVGARVGDELGDDMVDLYHATSTSAAARIRSSGPDLGLARPRTDFGAGFYTSTDAAQALRYARTKFRESGEAVEVLHFRVSRQSLDAMRIRRFESADDQWRSFVGGNRTASAPGHGFDVVEGPVLANPDAVAAGEAPRGFGHQISFHTSDAVNLVRSGIQ